MAPLEEVDSNITTWTTPQRSKKRGPKPTPLKDRHFRVSKPVQRLQRSYSKRKKEEVVMWLIHHRIEVGGVLCAPSLMDASNHFKIPKVTIHGWKQAFSESYVDDRIRVFTPHWPGLEAELYKQFQERRAKSRIVTTSWFRAKSRVLFRDLYPSFPDPFKFSVGWYRGFLRRHNIVKRRVTKQSTKRPDDYIEVVNMFLRFIRRVSSVGTQSRALSMILSSPKRRFLKRLILNLDETPIPFEFLDGETWDFKGAKTVAGHTDRSGWNKRQATLVLYIFADGTHRLQPKLIFHGVPTEEGGQIWEKEGHLYHPDVTVAFNKTAYNNEELLLQWIEEELTPLATEDDEDTLLVMDAATFHNTEEIKKKLRDLNITLALIPGGCISLLQPLDTAINKPFKQWLEEATDRYVERKEREEGPDFKWSVSDKRIMTTHIVAEAIQQLIAKADIVKKAFLNCGISIRHDGLEDYLIKIKDIPAEKIDFTGWEIAEQIPVTLEEEVDLLFDEDEMISMDDDDLLTMTRYHEKKVKDLQRQLKERGLKVSGKKAELVRRLQEHDSQRSQPSEVRETIYCG